MTGFTVLISIFQSNANTYMFINDAKVVLSSIYRSIVHILTTSNQTKHILTTLRLTKSFS